MNLSSIDPYSKSFCAISQKPTSRWKGGLKLTTLNGNPVLTFLTTSQMKWKEFFQFIFGIGGFGKKAIRKFLISETTISKINALLFSQPEETRISIIANIRDNLFPFEEHRRWWNRHPSPISLAVRICTPPPSAQKIQKSATQIFQALPRRKEPVPAALLDGIKTTLSSIADAHDPIPLLENHLSSFDKLVEYDARFKLIQNDIHALVATMKSVKGSPKHLLAPLLQKIYIEDDSQKSLSLDQTRKTIADLLFLLDTNPSSAATLRSLEEVDPLIKTALGATRESLNNKFLSTRKLGIFISPEFFLYPTTMARSFLRPDGSLNLGFKHRLKELVPPGVKSDFVRDMHSVINQLQNDPLLCEKLQNFPIPQPGSVLDKAIHASLQLPYDAPLSRHDVQTACLSSLLEWRRQGVFENCYAHSFVSHVKDSTLHWILDDLKEIAEKECLTRKIGNKSYEFPVLFRLYHGASKHKILHSETSVDMLLSMPAVKNACLLLGCTPDEEREELLEAATAVSSEGSWSLQQALEWLAQKHSIKDYNTVRDAMQCLDALSQSPLLWLCENAIAGMFFPPLTAQITDMTSQRACFSFVLLQAFLWIAQEAGLEKAAAQLREMSLNSPLTEPEERALNTMLEYRKANSELASLSPEDLKSLKFQLSLIVKGDSLQKHFGSPEFSCLERMVMSFSSSDSPTSDAGTLVLCEKTPKGIVPVTQERLGPLCVEMFCSFLGVSGIDSRTIADKLAPKVDEFTNWMLTQFNNVPTNFLSAENAILFDGGKHVGRLLENGTFSVCTPEEVYFGFPSTQERLDLSQGRLSLLSFLSKVKLLNPRLVADPKMTGLADNIGHAYRLLHAHPTISSALENPEEVINRYEQQGESILGTKISQFPQTQELARKTIETISGKPDIEKIFRKGTSCPTIGEAIEKWHTALENVLHRSLSQEEETLFDLNMLEGFVQDGGPSYHDPFLHFGDTSHTIFVNGNPQSLHQCFWYNPMKKTWSVIHAPEGGGCPETGFSLEKTLFMNYHIPNKHVLKTQQEKHLLYLEGKVRNRLLKIETAFLAKQSFLEKEISSLSKAARHEILSRPQPDLPSSIEEALEKAKMIARTTPESAEKALLQCRELQYLSLFLRQKSIEEAASKLQTLAEQGIEIRTGRFGANSSILHRLDDPDAFSQWAIDS
jgi:hypothetical protein